MSDKIGEFSRILSVTFGKDTGEESGILSEEMTGAFQDVSDFVTDKLVPAFKEIAEFAWPLIKEVWTDSLKPTFEELQEFVETTVIPSLIQIKDVAIDVWEQIDVIVIPLIKGILLTIETIIEVSFGAIRLLLNVLGGDFEGAWQSIKDIGEAFWELITSGFDEFGISLQGIQDFFLGGLKSAWDSVWGSIRDGFNAFLDPIKDAIESLLERNREAQEHQNRIARSSRRVAQSCLRTLLRPLLRVWEGWLVEQRACLASRKASRISGAGWRWWGRRGRSC